MTSPIATPNYDRLKVAPGMVRQHSKAITAGQRSGETAARNVWKPYEMQEWGSFDPSEVQARAMAAASLASARGRERYATKVLG